MATVVSVFLRLCRVIFPTVFQYLLIQVQAEITNSPLKVAWRELWVQILHTWSSPSANLLWCVIWSKERSKGVWWLLHHFPLFHYLLSVLKHGCAHSSIPPYNYTWSEAIALRWESMLPTKLVSPCAKQQWHSVPPLQEIEDLQTKNDNDVEHVNGQHEFCMLTPPGLWVHSHLQAQSIRW